MWYVKTQIRQAQISENVSEPQTGIEPTIYNLPHELASSAGISSVQAPELPAEEATHELYCTCIYMYNLSYNFNYFSRCTYDYEFVTFTFHMSLSGSMVRASNRSLEGCRFDPCLCLRNIFWDLSLTNVHQSSVIEYTVMILTDDAEAVKLSVSTNQTLTKTFLKSNVYMIHL